MQIFASHIISSILDRSLRTRDGGTGHKNAFWAVRLHELQFADTLFIFHPQALSFELVVLLLHVGLSGTW